MRLKLMVRRRMQNALGVDRYLRAFHLYLHFAFRFLHRVPYFRRKFEDLSILLAETRPGDLVIDVGANIGFYTRELAHAVGPDGLVLAVEPVEVNRKVLERVLPKAYRSRIQVVPLIVSDHFGQQAIELTSVSGAFLHGTCHVVDNPVTGASVEVVDSTTIDHLSNNVSGRRVALLKIDVEGHEDKVLGGALRTLADDRPFVACEIHERRIDQVLPIFEQSGYAAFVTGRSGQLVPLDRTRLDWRTRNDYFFRVLRSSGGGDAAATE